MKNKKKIKNVKMLSGLCDIDRLILEKLDNPSLFNLSLTNKYFNNEIQQLCKKRLQNNYSALYSTYITKQQIQRLKESYFKFYIRNVHYLNKLKNEYGIEYINVTSFDPPAMYRVTKWMREEHNLEAFNYNTNNANVYLLRCHIENKDEVAISTFIDNIFPKALVPESIRLVLIPNVLSRFFIEFNNYNFITPYLKALPLLSRKINLCKYGSKEIIMNILVNEVKNKGEETKKEIFSACAEGAARLGDLKLLKFIKDKSKYENIDTITDVLLSAITNQHYEFFTYYLESLEYLKEPRHQILLTVLYKYVQAIYFLSQEESDNVLHFLSELYLDNGGNKTELFFNLQMTMVISSHRKYMEDFLKEEIHVQDLLEDLLS